MDTDIAKIKKYVRAANYLTAAQIYLKDNFLLERDLNFEDIKPRLLGHWGTCPGINFVYANLNYLIKKHDLSMMFVLGPGHGFPALQANLFIEGTLQKFYPQASLDQQGVSYICKNFSWPYGFPSHSNPGAPGAILEGGELGYSLSTSYGAVLDNPDLIVACLIGDGEAETGPLATSWHLNKLINPATSGAVLPILHLNGYKISGPTLFGRMSGKDLEMLFYGYGYQPIFVEEREETDVYEDMVEALERSYKLIHEIQSKARNGETVISPRFPMIILRTPKGWTGIKELKGEKIEGNNLSHQVVGMNAKTDELELEAVNDWMKSYNFNSLFNPDTGFIQDIYDIVPLEERCMGMNEHAFSGKQYKELLLPDIHMFAESLNAPGSVTASNMKALGKYFSTVFSLNERNRNFRLLSPDETYSNKLDEVFKSTTRPFELPIEKWDKDLSQEGRVIEMLSEHSLQGLAQGYILTGRHAVFASYEAFIQIISSMADQYAKFLKVANEIEWRGTVSSINYILTSSGWRQDHNGFSHQNPGFLSDILEKEYSFIKAYFPADANSALVVMKRCLESKNGINIIVAGKTPEPCWLTEEEAEKELEDGLMVWDFASDENPDIVLVGVGDYMTKEVVAAIDCIKLECPKVKVRCVNVMELTKLHECDFENYFTTNKPVIFNYHGYPDSLKKLLFDRNDTERFSIHGYIEQGSTTTPFDMQIRNKTSRWHLAMEAFLFLAQEGVIKPDKAGELVAKYEKKIDEHRAYIIEHGDDPDDITKWVWKRK